MQSINTENGKGPKLSTKEADTIYCRSIIGSGGILKD